MKKILQYFVCLLILIPSLSWGATTYYGDASAGGNTGADCGNRKAISAITHNAGDISHLCGTISVPITIGAANEQIIFEPGSKISMDTWTSLTGAINCNTKSGLIIDGGAAGLGGETKIEATNTGSPSYVYPAGTFYYVNTLYGVYLNKCNSATVQNLAIKNIYQRVNGSGDPNAETSAGIYVVDGNDVTIVYNTVDMAKYGINVGTNSYSTMSNVSIHHNKISNASTQIVTALGNNGTNISGADLHHNDMTFNTTWSGHWGEVPYKSAVGTFTPGNTLTATGFSATIVMVGVSPPTLYIGPYTGTLPANNASITDGTATAAVNGTATYNSASGDWHHGDGIHIWGRSVSPTLDTITGLKIHDNSIIGNPGGSTTSSVYLEAFGSDATGTLVYNNYLKNIVSKNADGFIYVKGCSYSICTSAGYAGATPMACCTGNLAGSFNLNPKIINNTLVGDINYTGFAGIEIGSGFPTVLIENNIIKDVDYIISLDSTDQTVTSDYNNYYPTGRQIPFTVGAVSKSWAVWKSTYGYDATHSTSSTTPEDPMLDANGKLTSSTQSGANHARDGGADLSSIIGCTAGVDCYDRKGTLRSLGSGWDMGADEYDPGIDATPPTVTAFTVTSPSNSLTVSITSFTATDNTAVTGYLVNESASTPSVGDAGWAGSAQTSYIFGTAGAKTLYSWAKDAAGNISSSLSAGVTITLPAGAASKSGGAYMAGGGTVR